MGGCSSRNGSKKLASFELTEPVLDFDCKVGRLMRCDAIEVSVSSVLDEAIQSPPGNIWRRSSTVVPSSTGVPLAIFDEEVVVTIERPDDPLSYNNGDGMKEFEFGGVKIVRCAVQGWRKTMEDVALVHYGVPPRKDTLVLGVFDGHSGSEAAEFAREKLLGHIKATDEWQRGDVTSACEKGFLSADIAMRKSGITSGTTAVLAFLGPNDIIVANCGDSRSVLSRGGRQLPMSIDHKPGRKGERRRIVRSGGYLDETDPKHPRVVRDNYNMSIATSRALGDFDFKNDPSRPAEQQMVSPVPEFYTRDRSPEDEFLVLASDGVWDVIDNPGMVAFLAAESARLDQLEDEGRGMVGSSPDSVPFVGNGGSGETKLEALGRSVLRRCYDSGSRDNMTIVIADLRRTKESSERPEPAGGDSLYPSPIPGLVGVGDGQEGNTGHPGYVGTEGGYRGHEDTVPGSLNEDTGQSSPEESDEMGRTCDGGTVEFERLSGVERPGFEYGDMGMREGKLQLRPPESSGKETAQAVNGS